MKFSPHVPVARSDPIRLNTTPVSTFPSLDTNPLDRALLAGENPIRILRRALKQGDAALRERFTEGTPVEQLVQERAVLVDALIMRAFQVHLKTSGDDLALIAVGGYGRSELHPHSDIDLLLLIKTDARETQRSAIESFVALLWDIGLEASHSVRTPEECATAALADITIATNLMESRLLCGSRTLFTRMHTLTDPPAIWDSADFFSAKFREQQQRHQKYHDTPYRLEPNIKEGPGGLRDIQMIGWVAKRHFGVQTLHGLVEHGFLTEQEYLTLAQGQIFLWRIRFALHVLNHRREDRLLFDAQMKLARQFGYRDTPRILAVEQFMQEYYRTIKELGLLNEMLLQSLEEVILVPASTDITPLGDDFTARNGFLHAIDNGLFTTKPSMLLEIFHVLQQHPRLKGIDAVTLRALRQNLHRIDGEFRADPVNRKLFMDILREPQGVTHELRRMSRYGVLGNYLPAFGAVIGRMQYDLFHTYTVDEHILFVVSNLRRFALSRYDEEFPLCSKIMQTLPKPEIAYLAALFHDIAKGRGGDHSELGAQDAEIFCLDHGLSRYEARMVAWLVQNHLLLSITAQKRDISDPQVLHEFASRVSDQMHLDYLYILTVADVRGTNPELWNSWKASLFKELYRAAGEALRHGLENPIDKEELIHETQQIAMQQLREHGFEAGTVFNVWHILSEEYFLQHTADEVVWHTTTLSRVTPDKLPIAFVREQPQRGGTAVCVYSRNDDFIFGRVTAVLSQLGLTVLDARLMPVGIDSRLDTYVVLEDDDAPISEPGRLREIEQVLRREINRHNASPIPVTRQAPRQVRMFTTPTQIHFAADPVNERTVLEISAGDRPGLLSQIGQALKACEIRLQNAKITTVGERAEDVFFITDASGQPLDDKEMQESLRVALLSRIGEAS
ncbi:MAG TPA: [protein-PII] uridylyltransferase [Gammaproteobacteria bacterium]|jgi:[protein-PII] uridylyltransferase|nr:[protein-PII] uridylyltransferase [Gammaproteobacteria bacterium]